MNAIIMAVQPKWCELIASGKKIFEIRKSYPRKYVKFLDNSGNIAEPFKVYIYCTKVKTYPFYIGPKYGKLYKDASTNFGYLGNGNIIGEFVCRKIEAVLCLHHLFGKKLDRICNESCLSYEQLSEYLGINCCGKPNIGYAWHISDLKIYDEPKELSMFLADCTYCGKLHVGDENCRHHCYDGFREISRAPQSWMYCKEREEE